MLVHIVYRKIVKNKLELLDDIIPAENMEVFPSGDMMVKSSGRKLPQAVPAGKLEIIQFFS